MTKEQADRISYLEDARERLLEAADCVDEACDSLRASGFRAVIQGLTDRIDRFIAGIENGQEEE
jgi:hypothetical protein